MTHKNISIYQQHIGSTINALAGEVRRTASTIAKNPLVTFRIKNPKTLKKKMLLKNTQSIFSINDIYGIRIIVESVDEAYGVLEKISQTFSGFLDHDYIKKPKTRPSEPGLKGKMLRLLQFIAHKNGVPFEIQITTAVFHKMNELLHKGYHCKKYHS